MYCRSSVRMWVHPFFEANDFEEATMYSVAFKYENGANKRRETTEQNFSNSGKQIIFVGAYGNPTIPIVNFSPEELVKISCEPFLPQQPAILRE